MPREGSYTSFVYIFTFLEKVSIQFRNTSV